MRIEDERYVIATRSQPMMYDCGGAYISKNFSDAKSYKHKLVAEHRLNELQVADFNEDRTYDWRIFKAKVIYDFG